MTASFDVIHHVYVITIISKLFYYYTVNYHTGSIFYL